MSFQQLVHIEMLNDMLLQGVFKDDALQALQITAPVKIPKSFGDDPDKPYHIPWIEMSPEVQSVLDYEGKIDRGSAHIGLLIEDGRKQGREFLKARARMVAL
jgi:NTE family protein